MVAPFLDVNWINPFLRCVGSLFVSYFRDVPINMIKIAYLPFDVLLM